VRELKLDERYTFEERRAKNIRVPTLLLLGGASPPFFGAAMDLVQQAVPHAKRVILPGQTHVAIDRRRTCSPTRSWRFSSDEPA